MVHLERVSEKDDFTVAERSAIARIFGRWALLAFAGFDRRIDAAFASE
jgi:hypothetical protein